MKKVFALFALFFTTAIVLTACSSNPSVSGNFRSQEYVVSIGDTMDFYDELTITKGANKSDVKLVSSNSEVLQEQDGQFVALTAGRSIIFAQYRDEVFTQASVVVKNQYSTPIKPTVDESGLMQWDKSYTFIDNSVVYGESYILEIANITGLESIDENALEFTEYTTGNSFQLEEIGSYYVKLTAIGYGQYVDPSEKSQGYIVNYGVMGLLEEVAISGSDQIRNERATISWQEKENASYDVYLNGIKVYSDLEQNSFDYDYVNLENGQSVTAKVVAKDKDGVDLPTTSALALVKLESPTVDYFSSNASYLSFSEIENASSYSVYLQKVSLGSSQYITIEKDEIANIQFDGLESGLYSIEVRSMGGTGEELYLNSKPTTMDFIAKLATPQATVTFEGRKAIFNFEDVYYNNRYLIFFGDQSVVVEGQTCEVDLSALSAGDYTFTIKAIPNLSDGSVEAYVEGSLSTQKVIASDAFIFDFKVLNDITGITHRYSKEDGVSTFTFNQVYEANYYNLYINGTLVSDPLQSSNLGYVNLSIDDLNNYAPQDNKYIIRVEAGRNEDGVEKAPLSTFEKTLEVLDLVSKADTQTNGYYRWDTLDNDSAMYYYDIYEANQDYQITSLEPVASAGTSEGQTIEALDFGYYVIRIRTTSINYDSYLDSDFYDENGYFEDRFLVYEQIETPNVTFSDENGYQLIIDAPLYAGGFEVYVDGSLDGSIYYNNDSGQATYNLVNQFTDADTYQIEVVATVGQRYDGALHTDSQPFELTVTRLAQPNFTVTELTNSYGLKTAEQLSVTMIANASYPVIKLDGQVVNSDNASSINIIDQSVYDNEFSLTLFFVAGQNQGNDYFIDGVERTINFRRLAVPTNIDFNDGILSWHNSDSEVEGYYLTLTLTNDVNGNSYFRKYIDSTALTLDLQTYINNLCASDSNFSGAYNQAESVIVELSAFKNSFSGQTYVLPSANGTTTSGGTSLTLYKLDAPVLTFNPVDLILSWSDVAQGTTYDIYVGGVLAREDYTTVSITLANLGDYSFLNGQDVYVRSKNVKYLTSENSNVINIKELASIQTITISNASGEAVVSFTLSSDIASTSAVQVNGSSDNVSYTPASQSGSFNLADFDSTSFALQVIAENNSQSQFYYNSIVTTFELVDLEDMTFSATIDGDNITWNNIANDFIGNNIYPISYTLTITNGEDSYTIDTTETSYNIQSIEDQIGVVLDGSVNITVLAKVSSSYILTLTDGQARGYYGDKQSEVQTTQKLLPLENIEYEVVDDTVYSSALENRLNSYLLMTFADRWTDKEGVYFEVSIINGTENNVFYVTSSPTANYSLTNQDGYYYLRLNRALLGEGSSIIIVSVHASGYITSQGSGIVVNRLGSITRMGVSQDGLLTITNSVNSSYLVQISVNNTIIAQELVYDGASNNQLDLMQEGLLKDKYGYYTISVIAYDANAKMLPSSSAIEISGTKLQGIRSLEISDEGYLIVDIYPDDNTDLRFIVKLEYLGQDYRFNFTANKLSSATTYQIALLELFSSIEEYIPLEEKRYNFEIAVGRENYIRSDFVPFEVDYTIDVAPSRARADMANDYFLFEKREDDDTIGVAVRLYTFDSTLQAYVSQSVEFLEASELIGYWCTNNDDETKYFSKTYDGTLENVTQTECYAISINELLADYSFGRFYIEVARVGRGEVFNQYSKQGFELLKLNKVNDDTTTSNYLRIEDNNLLWQWLPDASLADISVYTPTAYYITFTSAENEDDESYSLISYSSAFDLREANLTPGKNYNITVKAVSSNLLVIASDDTENQTQALRYTQPLSLDVVNGRIVFNEEAFKNTEFMQTITEYFVASSHEELLYNIMGDVNYLAPLYFHTSNLSQQMVTLRFTVLDSSGAETSTYYDVSIIGYQLFPDITIENNNSNIMTATQASYFDLIEAYANTIQNLSTTNATNFKDMASALGRANRGIAGGGIMISDFADQLPAGEYSVSVYQRGNLQRYIDSEFSNSVEMFITASPSVTLSSEVVDDANNYYATLGSVQTYIAEDFDEQGNATSYSYQYVTHYQMILRFNYHITSGVIYIDRRIDLDLVYSEGAGWGIYLNSSPLEGIISDVENGHEVPSFKINMTALRNLFDTMYEDQPIDVNTTIRADIYALSEDNGYVPNGKSAVFNIRYLDLPTDSISFQNGQMVITTTLNDRNYILMRYLAVGSGVAQRTIQINNGIAIIDLPREGAYQYIVLSINGSISYNTINVESKMYAIENLYKLSAPTLSTADNNLQVRYNSVDFNYTEDQSLHFLLANDVSLRQGDGYYYSNILKQGATNTLTYRVGSVDATTGNVAYSSELTAETFYAYLLGNSGQVEASVPSGQTSHGADFIWTFYTEGEDGSLTPATMLFSSDISQISASMLNVVNGSPYVSEGNVRWPTSTSSVSLDGGQIIYQVTVNYYNLVLGENEFDTTYSYVSRDIYYTTNNSLDADYISQNYDYYTIEVVALGGIASSDIRSITTIENERYLITDSVYYEGQDSQVLRGRAQTLGSTTQPITRTPAPVLKPSDSVNNNGVSEGKIVYYITTSNYGSSVVTEENSADASARTTIRANYSQGGRNYSVELTGTYEYTASTSAATSGYILVTFTPDEGQLNDVSPFNIIVQMYSGSGLLSKSLEISSVYKMTALDGNYQISLSGEQTIIDFSDYFRYITIAGDNSCYEIAIDYTTRTGSYTAVLDRNSTSKTFTITNDMTSLTIQVRDSQEASTVNRLLLLYSDSLHFNINSTSITENGKELIDIVWNSENYMFEWSWNNGNNVEDYEYYIEIIMDDLEVITTSTTDNFYMPQERGTILSFSLKARQNNRASTGELYLYSESIQFDVPEGGIEFDLFSGGNGSENNPYRIANAEDFYNISRRNSLEQSFYFILTADITLDQDRLIVDGEPLIKGFYGSLDGDGFGLTLNATQLLTLTQDYSTSLPGLSGLSFSKYFALFESLSPSSTVTDLELNLVVNITSLDGSDVLISPLTLYNYGQIYNVRVNSITITRLQGSGNSNDIFLAGIASVNYGQIVNCNNYADFSYNMPQQVNINFAYAGIASINASLDGYVGEIENCFNSGDVELRARQSNINVYASGITLVNSSVLNKVGNDGNFTLSSSVSCAVYFTGVTITSTNGDLSYCYNNGTFTSPTGASVTSYFAGIAYSLSSGTINYLVDTASNALVRISPISPSADLGTNYASVGSGTVSTISTIAITSASINCGDGYILRIQSTSDGYTASIGRQS